MEEVISPGFVELEDLEMRPAFFPLTPCRDLMAPAAGAVCLFSLELGMVPCVGSPCPAFNTRCVKAGAARRDRDKGDQASAVS